MKRLYEIYTNNKSDRKLNSLIRTPYYIKLIINTECDNLSFIIIIINYKTGGICRQEGRPTNIGCQNTPTQNRLSSVTDSQMPQDRSTERNKKYEGQHSGENKRKMAGEEDAWTIAT